MSESGHQIEAIWYDDDAECAMWRCSCGYDANDYGDIGEARYAAAEHQLPERLQRDIQISTASIEDWRQAVLFEADAEAMEHPQAWRWYRDTATQAR